MSCIGAIWGRNRPIAEDCACLDISRLKDISGLLPHAHGVYEYDGSTLIYWMNTDGTTLTIAYRTNGHEVQQQIDITTIAVHLKNVASRKYFLCPFCEKKCCKLYLSKRRYEMACVKCGNLCYELQAHHNHNIYYLLMKNAKEERVHYEKWRRRHAKRHPNGN